MPRGIESIRSTFTKLDEFLNQLLPPKNKKDIQPKIPEKPVQSDRPEFDDSSEKNPEFERLFHLISDLIVKHLPQDFFDFSKPNERKVDLSEEQGPIESIKFIRNNFTRNNEMKKNLILVITLKKSEEKSYKKIFITINYFSERNEYQYVQSEYYNCHILRIIVGASVDLSNNVPEQGGEDFASIYDELSTKIDLATHLGISNKIPQTLLELLNGKFEFPNKSTLLDILLAERRIRIKTIPGYNPPLRIEKLSPLDLTSKIVKHLS